MIVVNEGIREQRGAVGIICTAERQDDLCALERSVCCCVRD